MLAMVLNSVLAALLYASAGAADGGYSVTSPVTAETCISSLGGEGVCDDIVQTRSVAEADVHGDALKLLAAAGRADWYVNAILASTDLDRTDIQGRNVLRYVIDERGRSFAARDEEKVKSMTRLVNRITAYRLRSVTRGRSERLARDLMEAAQLGKQQVKDLLGKIDLAQEERGGQEVLRYIVERRLMLGAPGLDSADSPKEGEVDNLTALVNAVSAKMAERKIRPASAKNPSSKLAASGGWSLEELLKEAVHGQSLKGVVGRGLVGGAVGVVIAALIILSQHCAPGAPTASSSTAANASDEATPKAPVADKGEVSERVAEGRSDTPKHAVLLGARALVGDVKPEPKS